MRGFWMPGGVWEPLCSFAVFSLRSGECTSGRIEKVSKQRKENKYVQSHERPPRHELRRSCLARTNAPKDDLAGPAPEDICGSEAATERDLATFDKIVFILNDAHLGFEPDISFRSEVKLGRFFLLRSHSPFPGAANESVFSHAQKDGRSEVCRCLLSEMDWFAWLRTCMSARISLMQSPQERLH